MNQASPNSFNLDMQPEKRLASGDKFWFLTDIQAEWRSYYSNSTPQRWFRVGAFDLKSRKVSYVHFSLDDVSGLLRAGMNPGPWLAPRSHGVDVKRIAHCGGKEKGRFNVDITLIEIDPTDAWIAAEARRLFAKDGFWVNSTRDMWKKQAESVAQEKAIEAAALARTRQFAARDVKADVKKVLGREVSVSAVLKRLVEERRLVPFGKGRARTYEVAAPMVLERVDWTG